MILKILLPTLALLGILGCAQQNGFRVSPVGPGPGAGPLLTATRTNGALVVFSAWRKTGTDDADHSLHSNYDILTKEGAPFLHVRNYVTPMIEDPATVFLAPGDYLVRARVQGYGFVSVPVVIEGRKTTTLYMDDNTKPGEVEDGPTAEVKLPDGRIIGWASGSAR